MKKGYACIWKAEINGREVKSNQNRHCLGRETSAASLTFESKFTHACVAYSHTCTPYQAWLFNLRQLTVSELIAAQILGPNPAREGFPWKQFLPMCIALTDVQVVPTSPPIPQCSPGLHSTSLDVPWECMHLAIQGLSTMRDHSHRDMSMEGPVSNSTQPQKPWVSLDTLLCFSSGHCEEA